MDMKKMFVVTGKRNLLPYSVDFTALPDGAMPSGWTGATWAISSGVAVNTPTLLAEQLTDPGLEAWTSATNLTSWNETGGGSVNQDADAYQGSWAARYDVDGSNNTAINRVGFGSLAVGMWVHGSVYSKGSNPGDTFDIRNAGAFINRGFAVSGTYTQYVKTGLITSVADTNFYLRALSASGNSLYMDAVSLKQVTQNQLYAVRDFKTPDIAPSVKITIPVDRLGGLIARLDNPSNPQNYIIAIHNRTNLIVYECVGGTFNATPLISAAAAYADNGTIQLVLSGANVSAYYRGSQVGTTVTTNVTTGNYHGIIAPKSDVPISEFSATKDGTTIMSLLGDSITATSNQGDYYEIVADSYPDTLHILNRAVSGESVMSGMDGQVVACASDNAEIIIIQLGRNDNNDGNMATLQAEAEENIAELKVSNPNATIYWLNVLPTWEDAGVGAEVDKSNIRTAIAAACAAQSITCWDTYTTPWIAQNETTDGTHPTAAGHAAIAAEVLARL